MHCRDVLLLTSSAWSNCRSSCLHGCCFSPSLPPPASPSLVRPTCPLPLHRSYLLYACACFVERTWRFGLPLVLAFVEGGFPVGGVGGVACGVQEGDVLFQPLPCHCAPCDCEPLPRAVPPPGDPPDASDPACHPRLPPPPAGDRHPWVRGAAGLLAGWPCGASCQPAAGGGARRCPCPPCRHVMYRMLLLQRCCGL